MADVGKVSLGVEIDQKDGIGKQFSSLASSMGKMFSRFMKSSMKSSIESTMSGAAAAAKPFPPPKIDVEAAKSQVSHLTEVLDNINAKLEILQKKLAELKEAYEHTLNPAKKAKIMEQIVNTEASILRLTKRSDDTAAKIWKLEDSLKNAENGIKSTGKETQIAGNRMAVFLGHLRRAAEYKIFNKQVEKANKELSSTDKRLKSAAKNAKRTGSAFAAAGKSAGKMGNQFTQAFRRIAKQVLIFSVLYKAIRGFQQFLGGSLKTNEEFAKSLNAIRTNMKVAFQPIFEAILPAINALMRGLAKATAYIAAFMAALSGKTYKQAYDSAKALDENRKAMDGYGKSAKKASKQLAAFDELNVLDTSTGDDAGGGLDTDKMEMPEMDFDSIQSQMDALALGVRTAFDRTFSAIRSGWDWTVATFGPGIQRAWGIIQPELTRWKEQFGVMFADILTLGEPLKNWWQNDLLPLWNQSIQGAATIFAGLSESVRNAFDSIWQAAFPIIEKFVADGLPRITEFSSSVQSIFLDMFGIVKQIFDDIWQEAVDPVLQLISQIIRDTLDIIFGWWDSWGKKIVANISETLGRIKELWNNLWEKMLKPIVTRMLEMLTKLWNDHLKGLLKEIGNFIGKLVTAAQDILNKFILPIVNWLVKKLGPVVAEIFDGVITVVGNALGAIIDAAKGIIKALGGIIDFIAGVFTGDWKRAWEGIKTFFGGIWDGVVALFKGAINIIIDTMNWLIRQLNKVKIEFPGWVENLTGYSSFGINIPEIPRLAKGGLVQGPTLAMVGDNPHANVDPEVVSPLSKLQEMLGGSNQEVVEALYMIVQLLQDYTRRPVILEANGTQLAKVVDNSRDDRIRRAGRTLGLT